MATNFEFYKDDLITLLINEVAIDKQGKMNWCNEVSCEKCIFFDSDDEKCRTGDIREFFNAEHIEPPKLTKRERAFCEMVGNKVIARDEDGVLNLFWDTVDIYKYKPCEGDGRWMKRTPHSNHITIDNKAFSFIKWSDEKPWSIEDLLKLEVE